MATKLDIQSLPNELLLQIFGEFALQPDVIGYTECSFEFEDNRGVLLQLSKTTRKLALAANTLLYETVITNDLSSLVSLFCTVSQDKQAASYVKHIAYLTTFNAKVNNIFQLAWETTFPQICKLLPDTVRLFRLAGLASGTSDEASAAEANEVSFCRQLDRAGERIFATLLALLPNL